MAGGPGKIGEYQKTLTKEQRKESARRAQKASAKAHRAKKTIREFALAINSAKPTDEMKEQLVSIGIDPDEATNAATIAAAVFMAAFNGDMKAVEKWERYVGEDESATAGQGQLADLITGLQREG